MPPVKGRLAKNIKFWEGINAGPWVLRIIKEGYALPFINEPEPADFKNNASAHKHSDFVTSEIKELLSSGRIKEVSRDEVHVINPLTVADNDNKLRLILDCRYINQHFQIPKFKCEDIRTIRDLFQKDDYFFKCDIKQGYHHIDILESHQKYLGFAWEIDGKLRLFVFTVLVFGLSTAPFLFTKLIRVLIKHWRSLAIRIFAFIDDILGGGRSFNDAVAISNFVKNQLEESGFVINTEKSHWVPMQQGEHLGYLVDLKRGLFEVPQRRRDTLFNKLLEVEKIVLPTARVLASLVGVIISMYLGLGPVVRMRTRSLYAVINEAVYWDERVALSGEALDEIHFWLENFDRLNGFPIWPASPLVSVFSYSDASELAWGGYIVSSRDSIAKGSFSENEINTSSTYRELKATLYVLASFADQLKGKVVKHHSDNQNVVRVLFNGSKKQALHKIVLSIFNLCIDNKINLLPEWVPRDDNVIADLASKSIDRDDFMLHPDIFAALDILWGPHTIDRFSSFRSRQLPRFNSRWANPCSEGVDAFSFRWDNENNWLFPPPKLIPRVLQHLSFSKAEGTLIVPEWPSAHWWPLVYQGNDCFINEVRKFLVIHPRKNAFLPAVPGFSLFDDDIPNFNILALRICY